MQTIYQPDDNGNYHRVQTWEDGSEISMFISGTKTDAIRIDSQTVEDVVYQFDPEQGAYVEQSRTTRIDPLPPEPEERISQLETENLELKLALAELAEAQQSDKLDVQLALAELAELLTGGA